MDILLLPSGRSIWWRSIRKAFPRAGAAAASSIIVNALDRLGGNHSHAPAPAVSLSSSHARDATVNEQLIAARRHVLPPNHPQTIRVRCIAARLIATASEECDGKWSLFERIRRRCHPVNNGGGGVDWRVDVVADEQFLYAYSHYKGIVTVSTGFLEGMRTDADVAAVLAHEVAHVMARHGLTTLRNRLLVRFLVNFAAELLDVPRHRFAEDRWEFTFQRPWYLSKEYEADRLGLLLLVAAGYDPRIAPKMIEKLERLRETTEVIPDDDDAHPAPAERIRRLSQDKVMGQALDLYAQALRSGKGERAPSLDSWSSTFTYGLSWARFWADEWLQGVPIVWNKVRSSFTSPPRHHRNHVAGQVQVVLPANWRSCDKGILAGLIPVTVSNSIGINRRPIGWHV